MKANELSPKDFLTLEDFNKFPILTKKEIEKNYENLISNKIKKSRVMKSSTSGSTGKKIEFLVDNNITFFINRSVANSRMFKWMGISYPESNVRIWGTSFKAKKNRIIDKIRKIIKSTTLLSGYNLTNKDIDDYIDKINSLKPSFITSYPSIFHTIAMNATKKIKYNPKALTIGGEKLYSYQREVIEKFFNAKIFDFYGSRDCLSMACECDKHKGLHLFSDIGYLEVVDENNNVIHEGEGEIVYTSFTNYAMPLIRYKNGDRARISQRYCSCGRTLPLIEEVLGRSFEVIEFPNGNRVGGTFWTILMRKHKGIDKFEVIQLKSDLIKINYITDENYKNEILYDIHREIVKKGGNNLKIDFQKVTDISVLKNGKLNFVRSEINKNGPK